MKQENAIEVRDITKKFKVFYDKGSELKERLLFRNRNRYENRWVLNGISFDVKKGEAVGLVGHNGCGKSTTLKLLTKIIYPDEGTIEMRGRVSSLIELGAGFHADMSGKENIYTNASIFGLTRREIEERLDDIIAFSELEDFIDNPVRTYSSGMYMRLAFSVAINVDADILLIDEILAVGDANFQAKCFNKLREIKTSGTTIVIVSHSLGQIEQICERSLWIHDGIVQADGVPRDVHPRYLNYMGEKRQEIAEKERERQAVKSQQEPEEHTGEKAKEETGEKAEEEANEDKTQGPKERKRWGNGSARIKRVDLWNQKGEAQNVFATGEEMTIVIDYQLKKKVEDAVLGIALFRSDGIHCYGTNTRIDQIPEFSLTKSGRIKVKLEHLNLLPGEYLVDIAIESDIGVPVDYYKEAAKIEVYSMLQDVGIVRIEHSWEID